MIDCFCVVIFVDLSSPQGCRYLLWITVPFSPSRKIALSSSLLCKGEGGRERKNEKEELFFVNRVCECEKVIKKMGRSVAKGHVDVL